MKRAGYDPRGMVEFLQVLRADKAATRYRSRPSSRRIRRPGERVRRLEQEANRLAGGRRDSQSFQNIRARMSRLGPAASMRTR